MKRILGLLSSNLLLGALLLSAPAAAETPAALGLLEIRGAESLAAAGFELSQAAGQPVPKEMISLGLYGALGTMPGMGLPAEGTVRAVAFDNGTTKAAGPSCCRSRTKARTISPGSARAAGRMKARPPTACCTTSRRTTPPWPGKKSIS